MVGGDVSPLGVGRGAGVSLSVITLVADRADHLGHLAHGLARSTERVDELVVVDMGSRDDPRSAVAVVAPGVPIRWVELAPVVPGGLPLARARNAGAAAAASERLLFLDVDCIPSASTVASYADAIDRGGLVCGPVRWLERSWDHGLDLTATGLDDVLDARSMPHPVRPAPTEEHTGEDHELFWSLAFGVSRSDLDRIGGFDEGYVGYGGEDTDLGFAARRAGVPMRWLSRGTVYHQFHRSSTPPAEHLGSIVTNARRFRRRWGVWPMGGWLDAFAAGGLIEWDPTGDDLRLLDPGRPAAALRVASVPASHPYARKVHHDDVVVLPDPTCPWWPHPVLEPGWAQDHRHEVDVVHVHFGFEHRTPTDLARWCAELDQAGLPLIVTVHDLVDPHSRTGHDAHRARLEVLVGASAQLVTLTEWAAAEIEATFGRSATVIPHPFVAPGDLAGPRRPGPPRVGVHFKAFRANALAPHAVVPSLVRAAERAGAELVVAADDHAAAGSLAELRSVSDRGGVEPLISTTLDDAQLARFVGDLDVLVLPYRFGTHSGMVELCRDLGTRPVVPATGGYHDQWDGVVEAELAADGAMGAAALTDAVVEALQRGAPAPAPESWRRSQLAAIRDAHGAVVRSALGSVRRRPVAVAPGPGTSGSPP